MNIEERIAHHRRMAESYRNAYLRKGVEEGEKYEAWQFAPDAVYCSPYFTGDEDVPMHEFSVDAAKCATMEAKAYSLKFPDWKPADFRYWPADNGFVMKTRWEGCTRDGNRMGFYSYGFVLTNEQGQIARWETHVNEEYGDFLDVAIGARGPFRGNAEYIDALDRYLDEAGVSV